MVIRCRHCGKLSETENELMDGMSICCPYCGVNDVEMYYRKMADGNLKSASRSTPTPMSTPKTKSRAIGGGWMFLFVIVVIGGLAFCWWKSYKGTDVPEPAIQNGSVAANESDELEEQSREARALVESVEKRFKTGPLVFASDFSEKKWPLKKDGTFYAIGRTYQTEQRIYEAKVENGKVATVRAISPQGIEEIGAVDFSRKRALVVGDDGIVWIFGTGKAVWTEKATLAQDEIDPANTELKRLYPILKSWGRIPECKLRISLKPLNGGKSIPMGIIDYGAPVTAWKIREALLPALRARREEPIDLPKPKLKTFKPNVVFYDGNTVRTGDVTQVPRIFQFHGTNVDRHRYVEAGLRTKRRWEKWKDEAERQERKLQEVRNENERLMQEYESKVREMLDKEISGEEIEAEARKYVLLVERCRSK